MRAAAAARANAPRLRPEERVRLGKTWLGRMHEEHRAVGAFGQLTTELVATGCDHAVLALVTRAAADEVAHAEVCRTMARRYLDGDQIPHQMRGEWLLPAYGDASRSENALLNVVTMCCLSETFTTAYFTRMLQLTSVTEIRAAVRGLLADELGHARLGWAHLGWSLERTRSPRKMRALVAHWLPALLDDVAAEVFEEACVRPEPDVPRLIAHGYLGRDTAAELYRTALTTIILPGFATLGVDVGSATRWARDRGA